MMHSSAKFSIAFGLFLAAGFQNLAVASVDPTGPVVPVAASMDAPAPILRNTASVTGAQIRLGDLFTNAGAHADEVVATAPAPGASQMFDSDWLVAIARRHNLDWTPPNSFVQIRVERAATLITRDMIEAALSQKLADGQSDRQIRLESTPKLYADASDANPVLAVDNVNLDAANGRFTAEIRLDRESAGAGIRVSGRIDTIVQVPTLSHPMMPGEIIGKDDITWTTAKIDQLPGGNITDANALIGRSPRRPLHAQQFLRNVDVEQPTVIRRNELIMIVLDAPGMYLTAEGKAMENGGKGDVIRVTNVQSNRAIDAVVLGSGRVGVVAPGMQAMNN